jgi:tetratricopeptide (TPR) repeat protein
VKTRLERRLAFVIRPDTRRRCGLVALAAALFLARQYPAAHNGVADQIAAITAQIARNPASGELLVRRAELYRFSGQWREALADLDRAGTLDPSSAAVDLARAHVFLESGNQQAAVDAASRFLTRQPEHGDAFIVRGRARARLGFAPEAAADFTRALDRRPEPDLYIERAHAILGSGTSHIGTALRGLDEGIARLGPIVTLELEAIDLELRLKRYDAALSRLDRVSAQAARKESWLARRGAILEQAGRIDEARRTYRAALTAAMNLPESIRRARASSALIERLRADLTRLGLNPTPFWQKR